MAWPVDPGRVAHVSAPRRQGSAHIRDLGEEGVQVAGRILTGREAQAIRESFLLGHEAEERELNQQRAHQAKTAEMLKCGITPDVWQRWTKEKSEYVFLAIQRRRDRDAEELRDLVSKNPHGVRFSWNIN